MIDQLLEDLKRLEEAKTGRCTCDKGHTTLCDRCKADIGLAAITQIARKAVTMLEDSDVDCRS
jgi:hypothetical protein